MKSPLLLPIFSLILTTNALYGQNNAVRLSIESFYSDEGPLTSKEYRPEDFSGVMPGDPSTYLNSGIEKLKAAFYKESLDDFKETVILAPDCSVCYYYRGLNYLLMDSLDLAKKDFKTAIYHDVMMIQAYNDLSGIYYYEGEIDSAELILERGLKFYPAYLPTYFNLGYYKLLQGRFNKAIKLFDKCLEMDSCHEGSILMKASVFLAENKNKDAESLLDKAVDCNHKNTGILLLTSAAKYERDKIDEAIAEIDKALAIEDKYIYYYLRGLLKVEVGQYESAINDFIKAYTFNSLDDEKYEGSPGYKRKQLDFFGLLNDYTAQKSQLNDGDAKLVQKGICLLMAEEYDKAATELKKLTKGNSRNDFFFLLMGIAKEKTYDLAGAIENYNKCLELNNRNVTAHKRRGLLHQRDGDIAAAMVDFNAMYEINPESSEALKYKGIAKMFDKQFAAALADFEEYERKFDSDSDIFYNKGQCQLRLGQLEGAVSSFKKVLNITPDDVEVIFLIAENNYSLGRVEEAIMMCDSVLNNRDCYVQAMNLKGVAQMDVGNAEEALSTFKSGISCSPYHTDFHINKGIAYIKLGKNEEAIKQMDIALGMAPANGLAYLIRAQAKHNLGDKSACKDLDKAISLGITVSEQQREAICR